MNKRLFAEAIIGILVILLQASGLAAASGGGDVGSRSPGDKQISLINPDIEVNPRGEINIKPNSRDSGEYYLNNGKGIVYGLGQSDLSSKGYFLEVQKNGSSLARIREIQPTLTALTPAPWKGSVEKGYLVNVQTFENSKLKTLVSCSTSIHQNSYLMGVVDSPIKNKGMTCFPVNREVCNGIHYEMKKAFTGSPFGEDFNDPGIRNFSDLAKKASSCTTFFDHFLYALRTVENETGKHRPEFDAVIQSAKKFFVAKTKDGRFEWAQPTVKIRTNFQSFADAINRVHDGSTYVTTYADACKRFFPSGKDSFVYSDPGKAESNAALAK